MKAAVIEAVNQVRVKDVPKPECGPGQVLIKIAYGGFCGPTEMCIIEGLHPRAKFPLVFCHEFAGTVEEAAPGSAFQPGDRVVVNPLRFCGKCETCRAGYSYVCGDLKLIGIDCDGGFAEYCAVPEENVLHIPDSLPFKMAAIVEPVAVGVHAVRGAGVGVGDSALVFGAGPIGIILAEVCRTAGAGSVTICETNPRRVDFARSLGFGVETDAGALSKAKKQYDFVLDSTGAEPVLPYAVELVKIRGKIAVVGKFDFPAKVNLHDVLFKEITMQGFRVYTEREFAFTVGMLAANAERFGRIIADDYALDDAAQAVEDFRSRKNLCKIVIHP